MYIISFLQDSELPNADPSTPLGYLVLKDVRLRCSFAATDSGGIKGSRLAVLDKYAHVVWLHKFCLPNCNPKGGAKGEYWEGLAKESFVVQRMESHRNLRAKHFARWKAAICWLPQNNPNRFIYKWFFMWNPRIESNWYMTSPSSWIVLLKSFLKKICGFVPVG